MTKNTMGRTLAWVVVALLAGLGTAPVAAQIEHPDHAAIVARMKASEAVFDLPIAVMTQRANAGDLRALNALAIRYQNGIQVKQSFARADQLNARLRQLAEAAAARGDSYGMFQVALQGSLKENWSDARTLAAYRVAAEAGSAEATQRVGWHYYWGRGVPENWPEAMRWWRQAAIGGSCDAMNGIAAMLTDPKHGPVDLAEAARWYRIAAESDLACGNGATVALASLYAKGGGNLPRDYGQALKYLLASVERGNPVAAMQIGFYYENGLGTPVNKAEALKWFDRAGYSSVAAARAELARLGVPEPK